MFWVRAVEELEGGRVEVGSGQAVGDSVAVSREGPAGAAEAAPELPEPVSPEAEWQQGPGMGLE